MHGLIIMHLKKVAPKIFAHLHEVFYFDICDIIAKNDTKGERLSDYSR